MLELTFINEKEIAPAVPEELLHGKRHLTPSEIAALLANRNSSEDGEFANLYVDASDGGFDPSLIRIRVFRVLSFWGGFVRRN